jgi:hypothetical protein
MPTPNPFRALIYSRKFWLAILALVNTIVSTYAKVEPEVIASANLVLLVVIGAIAYEDGNGNTSGE